MIPIQEWALNLLWSVTAASDLLLPEWQPFYIWVISPVAIHKKYLSTNEWIEQYVEIVC